MRKITLITLGVKDFRKPSAFHESLGWKKSEKSMETFALFPFGEMDSERNLIVE